MKKVLSLIAILCMALVFFAACDNPQQSTTNKPCEHNWVDATCEAPKTCSVCGATEGAALGHNPIEVFGQAPTCTEPGQTNFVYCDVCDKNLSEAKEIAPLGHTEETVAGTAATCTEAGKTDGKKCSVCGVTTVEQTVIEALGHKAGEDDGDVTTAVTCERCDHVFVEAKEAITLTIPTFENGAVTADKKNYAIGDTVKLTINPDWGYAQKLYIDGKPLMLDWNNNIYSFVAEKDTYVLNGTFELPLDLEAKDPARWETGNQAHGILTTYYPANNDSWWMAFKGNYDSLTVIAQNQLPIGETADNFFVYLRVTMENGNTYLFRVGTDKGGYTAYNRAGIPHPGDASADWSNWRNLSKLDSKITAEGVEFKVERQGANTLVLTVDGEVVDTYTMKGITAEDKIASVDVKHQGNQGKYVDIAYSLTNACNHTWVDATCIAPKTCSICKVTVGEKLDHVAGKDVVENNKEADCVNTGSYDKVVYCTVCGGEVSRETITVSALGHKDENADYKCDVCGANLCTNHVPGTTVVENEIAPDFDKTGSYENVTYCTICGMETSRETVTVPAVKSITLTIPTFENGSVTADKQRYAIGDTVTFTVTPAEGYAQKLYINGEPILVDTNGKYSFVADKDVYEITGEFVNVQGAWFWTAEYGMLNQAHGYVHAPVVSEKNGELVPTEDKYYGGRVLLTDPSNGTRVDYGVYLKITFSDGTTTAIRLVAKDSNGHYFIQAMGGILGPQWKWYYDLSDEENAAIASGEGVWFGLYHDKDTNTLKVTINDTVRNRGDITPTVAEGITIHQFKVQAYNYNYAVDFKCEFYMNSPDPVEPPVSGDDVTLNIGEFANGTVTADKESYKIGETVTLTIAPEGGYFQKLYINGEPLMLDWKTFTYSFTANKNAYEITGSFEKGLNLAPSDWGRWDDHNQTHGVLNTYYPNNNDSWWMAIKGNHNSLAIKVNNQLPIAETADNFFVYLRVSMENGNTYTFRIGTDKGGYTAYNRAGIQNPGDASADWSHWKNLSKFDSKITAEGVEFKVERQGANTLVITVDGEVVDTYTMNGITAEDKIASIDIKHQGNKGKYVEVPFEIK